MNIKQKKKLLVLIKQYKNDRNSLQQIKINQNPKNKLLFDNLKKVLDKGRFRYKIGSTKISSPKMFLFPNNTSIGISTVQEFKYTSYNNGKQVITCDDPFKAIKSIIKFKYSN